MALILKQRDLIDMFISFMVEHEELSRLSCLALINVSANEENSKKLLGIDNAISQKQVNLILIIYF